VKAVPFTIMWDAVPEADSYAIIIAAYGYLMTYDRLGATEQRVNLPMGVECDVYVTAWDRDNESVPSQTMTVYANFW
jgi:hypothetical protein